MYKVSDCLRACKEIKNYRKKTNYNPSRRGWSSEMLHNAIMKISDRNKISKKNSMKKNTRQNQANGQLKKLTFNS